MDACFWVDITLPHSNIISASHGGSNVWAWFLRHAHASPCSEGTLMDHEPNFHKFAPTQYNFFLLPSRPEYFWSMSLYR